MSPDFQSRNVPAARGGDISTFFRERGSEAFAPRMIGSRQVRGGWENLVDIFRGNDFGLFGLLMENGEGQRLAFVADGDV